MAELLAEAFALCRSMINVPRANHVSYRGGLSPCVGKSMPYKRAGKLLDGGRKFTYPGLISVPPACAA